MEENEHEQPIQGAQEVPPHDPSGSEGARSLDNFVQAAHGFGAALLLWGIGIGTGYVLERFGMVSGLLFFFFNIGGPGVSVLAWLFSRKYNRHFGRGALVFGIFSLVVIGGCWVNFQANFLQPPRVHPTRAFGISDNMDGKFAAGDRLSALRVSRAAVGFCTRKGTRIS